MQLIKGYLPGIKRQLLRVIFSFPSHCTEAETRHYCKKLKADYLEVLHLLELDFLGDYSSIDIDIDVDVDAGQCQIFFPFHEGLDALFTDLIGEICNEPAIDLGSAPGLLKSELVEIAGRLRKRHLSSKNRKRTIEAMVKSDVPFVALTTKIFQMGWGRNARLMNSSISDKTRSISISIAGNKKTTSELLRIYGLPASDSVRCVNEASALRAAREIGFPVVVKPADRERGIGVHALIDSDERLISAFRAASSVSKQILVEKHFHGQDYRIQIYEGVAYSVTHRSPGGVTGDGIHTVKELLASLNSIRRQQFELRQLEFDEDASEMLARQNLSQDSVPAAGQFVSLRSIANVDRGGKSVQVIDTAHPDNLALAARAARILDLDIAGIDLLISDISRSWRDVGALICEVNACPMINTEAIGRLLKMMSPHGYRIPSILVAEKFSVERLIEGTRKLRAGVGIATSYGGWVDGIEVCRGSSFTSNGRAILLNRDVRLIVNCITIGEISDLSFSGFPCDHYDNAILPKAVPASSVQVGALSHPVAKYTLNNLDKIATRNVYADDVKADVPDWLLDQLSRASQQAREARIKAQTR